MKRKYYYPTTLLALFPFLQNLCAKAPGYTAQLGITGQQLSFLNLMCALLEALNNYWNQAKRFSEDWTGLRKACFLGAPGAPAPAWPVWTGPATAPIGLDTGCNDKLRAIIQRWKVAPGYTDAIGEELGIVGAEIDVDPDTVQPALQVDLVAGQPKIEVSMLSFDAAEIEVNRGSGYGLLNVTTGAPLVDTHPLPAPGESDVWTYRAILRANNARVGQWSLPVAVPVMGI